MFPVVLRFAILMAVLSAIYIGLGWYMRWDRTRRLEDEHASGQHQHTHNGLAVNFTLFAL